MEVLRISPRTPIGIFLGAASLAVGALFLSAFWHDEARGPVWIGASLAVAGLAILAMKRIVEIDPSTRTVRERRSWLFVSRLNEVGFELFTGVAIARTPSPTPSYCVLLLAEELISLPTQGRNPRGAKGRADRIAQIMGVPVEGDTRKVSSVPML